MSGAALRWLMAATAVCAGTVAHASPPVEILVSDVGQQDGDGALLVELRLLNGDAATQTIPLPDRIEARVARPGTPPRTVQLQRRADVPPALVIAAGGFGRAAYRLSDAAGMELDGAMLSIPAWNSRPVTVAIRPAVEEERLTATLPAAPRSAIDEPRINEAAPPPADRSVGNAFLDNLSAYEPIYAAYGPGTNSEARIQLSLRYQLFGTRQAEGLPRSWRDGLNFAYTQRMFWNLGAKSSPFRNVDYQPELLYLTPSTTLASGITLSAQGGVRHESNGRAGDVSRSINTLYIAPMAAMSLGGGYRLSVAPRLWTFVGRRSDNPDIRRYRGNSGLFVEIGKDDGLRLSATSRFSFSSGKGAFGADLSYPLPQLWDGSPDLYIYVQSFVGYGENLLDYNRSMRRLRLGFALVR